jgi:hypothetical protein
MGQTFKQTRRGRAVPKGWCLVTVIVVPKPPKSAFNKHRPVSALLKNQILHMQEAEFRLPARQQTNIYINKIKTEGQAAEYISKVTARLHPKATRRVTFDIAAMGERKRTRKAKTKIRSRKKPKNKGGAGPKKKR